MKNGIERLSEVALGEKESTTVPLSRIADSVGIDRRQRMVPDVYRRICVEADNFRLGIEPDPRYTGLVPRSGESVVLFRLDADGSEPSEDFRAAAAVLGLASSVAAADEEVVASEEVQLEARLEESMHLSVDERARLRAWCSWLITAKPRLHSSVSTAKERLRNLPGATRRSIAAFAVRIAAADRVVKPVEVQALKKIYGALDLDEDELDLCLTQLESVHLVKEEDANRREGRRVNPENRAENQADVLLDLLFGTT